MVSTSREGFVDFSRFVAERLKSLLRFREVLIVEVASAVDDIDPRSAGSSGGFG